MPNPRCMHACMCPSHVGPPISSSSHTPPHVSHAHTQTHTQNQLCLSLAAEAALTLESGVVYVDSNGSFCPRRLRAILLDKARAWIPRQACMQRMHMSLITHGHTRMLSQAIHRQQEQQQHPPPGQPADNALADAALGRVQCLRAADDAALLSALDCLGQRLQGRVRCVVFRCLY